MPEQVRDLEWVSDQIRALAWRLGQEIDGYTACAVERTVLAMTGRELRARLQDMMRLTYNMERSHKESRERDRENWERVRRAYVRRKTPPVFMVK
jgi:hypothetical protein